MSKKEKVIEDIIVDGKKIGPKEGGIYSLLPYERVNKDKKALFKVGLADSFSHRIESYHTYYPAGLYISNLLVEPNKFKKEIKASRPIKRNASEAEKEKIQKQRIQDIKNTRVNNFKQVETFIFKDIKKHDGLQYKPTTRVKNVKQNQKDHGGDLTVGGDSEWFYTSKKVLDDAFHTAQDKFGGRNLLAQESELKDINKSAALNKKGSTYTGEIHYKIK